MAANIILSNNLLEQVRNICANNKKSIVVLTSMDVAIRDKWVCELKNAKTYCWSHSKRVIRHLEKRLNVCNEITIDSVYNVIYGGVESDDKDNPSDDQSENNEETDDGSQIIIPINSSKSLEYNSTVIFCEAQMLSQSFNQTELVRYGSGRLLDDVLQFVFEKGNHKLILIGDPYYLTYGNSTDSSLCIATLATKQPNIPIYYYEEEISQNYSIGKEELRTLLASSIKKRCFNNLHYHFDMDLENIKKESLESILKDWFSKPLYNDPLNAALFYTNNDCHLTNIWIKKHCLKNGENLAKGDLLIMNNNITLSADPPTEDHIKIYNGMYLTLLEIIGHEDKNIKIKTKGKEINVNLFFIKIRVKCISIEGKPEKVLFMLDNYFKTGELTNEEQIALRVFFNQLLRKETRKKRETFRNSPYYKLMLESEEHKNLSIEERQAIEKLIGNIGVKKELQKEVHTTNDARKVLSIYRKKWEVTIKKQILDTDPYLNAVWVSYGWAITVHKSLGINFENIWIKGSQNANSGISNDTYYRWLYSGISTAKRNVYISSPQYLTPLMNCHVDDTGISPNYNSGLYLIYPDDTPIYDINNILNQYDIHLNTKIFIGNVSERLSDYKLKDVEIKSEYLTMALFEAFSDNVTIKILIDNKGKRDKYAISNVRMECVDEEYNNEVYNVILQCASNNWPDDFRKEIYDSWKKELLHNNIMMSLIKSQDWHDTIMLFDSNNNKVHVEVWYNDNCFITRIRFLSIENQYIYNQFKKLFLNKEMQE